MREVVFVVLGMTCSACTDTVISKVKSLAGSNECTISLVTGECHVQYDDQKGLLAQHILEAVEDCGFDVQLLSDEEVGSTKIFSGKLLIQGMTCGACVSNITDTVNKLDGIREVVVSLVTEECFVRFDCSQVSMDEIKETIEDCGFDAEVLSCQEDTTDAPASWKKSDIRIIGVHDENASVVIRASLVSDSILSVDFLSDSAISVQYDKHKIGIRDIIQKLEALGYEADISPTADSHYQLKILSKVREIQFWRSTCFKSCFLAVFTMILYMGAPLISSGLVKNKKFPYNQTPFLKGFYYRDLFGLIVGTYIQFFVGGYFYKACWNSFKHRSGTMDTLVCISTSCAYFFSIYSIICNVINTESNDKLPNVIFDTSVMLIAFISIGKLMENKAKSATSAALSKLISLTPSSCCIIENNDYQNPVTIPIELLQSGDVVEVKPGMKIPSDGQVVQGETEVNESLMTGEALLVPKEEGSMVIGGSINGPGHFYFQATTVGDDSKLANIIKAMKQAQLTKAPIQRYADFLASIFVPSILIFALLTFLFWYILSKVISNPLPIIKSENGVFYSCFQTAISVVIVACPCALGLAAPTAIMVGTGIGAENQVLIKGGDILERFTDVKIFVFDKTGTLTTGNMSVKRFQSENMSDLDAETIALIKASESLSEHPVAEAITAFCTEEQLKSTAHLEPITANVLSSKILIGKGIKTKCDLNGKEYAVAVGSKSLMPPKWEQSSSLLAGDDNDYTLSYVSINDEVVGRFDIIDDIKKDSYQTVQYLNNRGFQTYMITGDTHSSAMKVALQVGIDLNNVYSEVKPSGKAEVVQRLMDENKGRVIFVGDGINDSPALVTSDVGIAISTGTDIAVEAADIVILSDKNLNRASLKGLVNALDIAEKTFRRIKLNIFWAICYNTIMIPVAMGVLIPWGIRLHPMAAGLAMALSSVSVVISSLMLKSWKPVNLEEELQTSPHFSSNSLWSKFFPSKKNQNSNDIEMRAGLIS